MGRLSALAAALIVAGLASLAVGRYPLPVATVLTALAGAASGDATTTAGTVVLMVRLPRIIAAIAIGAGLATAGSAYQTVFRNPMASPALLGVSAGAGFAASVALLMHLPPLAIQAAAFAGGLAAAAVAAWANRLFGGRSMIGLVLCGMVLAALFQALISAVKYVADPIDVLPTIVFWLMGSLARVSPTDAVVVTVPVAVCGAAFFALRWQIHLLTLEDQEAAALGIEVRRLRAATIAGATLITAATVSVGGIIGWVGLIIPHVARMVFGHDPDRLVPGTALLGGLFLLLTDNLARAALAVEVPLGVLTALVGAPFFLLLLARARRGQWA